MQLKRIFAYLFGNVPPYKRISLYEERTGIILLRPSRPSWSAMTRFVGFSAVLVSGALLIAVPRCDIRLRLFLIHRRCRLKRYIRFGGILDLLHPLYHFVSNATSAGITLNNSHRRLNVPLRFFFLLSK